MELTREELEQLKQLAEAASQGRWVVDALNVGARFNIETPDGKVAIAMAQQLYGDRQNVQRAANADYIAAANPEVILSLINQLLAAQNGAQKVMEADARKTSESSWEPGWYRDAGNRAGTAHLYLGLHVDGTSALSHCGRDVLVSDLQGETNPTRRCIRCLKHYK